MSNNDFYSQKTAIESKVFSLARRTKNTTRRTKIACLPKKGKDLDTSPQLAAFHDYVTLTDKHFRRLASEVQYRRET